MCHQDLELRPGPPCCTILDSSWPTLKVTPHTGTKQKCATITSKLWGRGGIHRQLLTTYSKPITGLGSYVMVLVVCLCCGRGRRLRNCTENVGRAERGAERGSSLSAEINVPFCPISALALRVSQNVQKYSAVQHPVQKCRMLMLTLLTGRKGFDGMLLSRARSEDFTITENASALLEPSPG